MDNGENQLFTRKSAIRHLYMLIPAAFVLIWTCVLIAVLSRQTTWPPATELHGTTQELWCIFTGIAGVTTLLAVAIYWNVRIWMLPFLVKSLLNLIGAVPIVNLLIGPKRRCSWYCAMIAAAYHGADCKIEYHDNLRIFTGRHGLLISLLAAPLRTIRALVVGLLQSAFYLVCAVGIPVLSPLLLLLPVSLLHRLIPISPTGTFAIGLLCLAVTLFLFVIHPLVSFLRNPKTDQPSRSVSSRR